MAVCYSRRSTPAYAVGGIEQRMFRCYVCHVDTDVELRDGTAVCEKHCPDHDYEYDRSTQERICDNCGKYAPPDYYDY